MTAQIDDVQLCDSCDRVETCEHAYTPRMIHCVDRVLAELGFQVDDPRTPDQKWQDEQREAEQETYHDLWPQI